MDSVTAVSDFAEGADLALVARIAAGDGAAFEVLMRRYNRRLYRAARSILKDDAEAEDAVQEAYWKAYLAMDGFRADCALSTWLTRIVINESLGRLRRNQRRMSIIDYTDDLPVDGERAMMNSASSIDGRPDAMAWRSEIRALIERNLDALPDAYRTVFMLRAVEEMPASEVAAVLDIPEATVRTRFFRACRLMRAAMKQEVNLNTKEAFSFAGHRCDRIVTNVLARLARSKTSS